MTIAVRTREPGSYGLKSRLTMCVAPVAALVYPFTLKAFNVAVTAVKLGAAPLCLLQQRLSRSSFLSLCRP
jgi:hypothetical protein